MTSPYAPTRRERLDFLHSIFKMRRELKDAMDGASDGLYEQRSEQFQGFIMKKMLAMGMAIAVNEISAGQVAVAAFALHDQLRREHGTRIPCPDCAGTGENMELIKACDRPLPPMEGGELCPTCNGWTGRRRDNFAAMRMTLCACADMIDECERLSGRKKLTVDEVEEHFAEREADNPAWDQGSTACRALEGMIEPS